nr:DUF2914 domain-containing protein [uncultured Desulfobacter sp.]
MMNKTSIEDRDQDLMKKFRNIVEEKKQLNEQEPQKRPWPAFTLAGFIMAAIIVAIAYHMIPERVHTAPSPTPAKVKTAALKTPVSMPDPTLTQGEKPSIPDEKPPQEPLTESAPVIPAKEEEPSLEVVQTPEKAAPIETLPEIVNSTDATIKELVICRSIKNRQYVSPENRFSMKNGAKPAVWTWMNALTDKPPQELSHIYYLNGKRFCRVILPVPFPRTRTWSKVTMKRPAQAGSWRVDVVNKNGQVIARANFTVEI